MISNETFIFFESKAPVIFYINNKYSHSHTNFIHVCCHTDVIILSYNEILIIIILMISIIIKKSKKSISRGVWGELRFGVICEMPSSGRMS